jgi:NADP-dependent 3-hydroxy acid dehydrogenase YdfG
MSESPVHLIVGATGSAGSATARRLAAAGATVALAGRDPDAVTALAEEVGGSAHTVDARDIAAVGQLVEEVVARHGRLDGDRLPRRAPRLGPDARGRVVAARVPEGDRPDPA